MIHNKNNDNSITKMGKILIIQSISCAVQAETVLEKRKRAVHLLKEGLESADRQDLTEENEQIQLAVFDGEIFCEPCAPLVLSQKSDCGDKSFENIESHAVSVDGVTVNNKGIALPLDDRTHCF